MASVKDNILLVKTAIKSLGELGVSREVYASSLFAFDESIAQTRQQALAEVLEKVESRIEVLSESKDPMSYVTRKSEMESLRNWLKQQIEP